MQKEVSANHVTKLRIETEVIPAILTTEGVVFVTKYIATH
jgi:hypothetical protein